MSESVSNVPEVEKEAEPVEKASDAAADSSTTPPKEAVEVVADDAKPEEAKV
jgi:hypothetical protein